MSKILKQYYCKAKNRRVWIELHHFEEVDKYLFRISTKTLKEKRDILTLEHWYTPETFLLINDSLKTFVDKQIFDLLNLGILKADILYYNIIGEND